MWQQVTRIICSSTRTEIAAAIDALHNLVVQRINFDSDNLVQKGNLVVGFVIEHERAGTDPMLCPFKKPWSLQNDGEPWSHLCERFFARRAIRNASNGLRVTPQTRCLHAASPPGTTETEMIMRMMQLIKGLEILELVWLH